MSNYKQIAISEDDWMRFLWSLSLSDHLGDAAEAVRSFAELTGLPMPGKYADFDEWREWTTERGIEEGSSTKIMRLRQEPRR